jgi:hypothetical protein
MKPRVPRPAPQFPSGQSILDKDREFLAAWDGGLLPRSIDAATILRVRQIKRAMRPAKLAKQS